MAEPTDSMEGFVSISHGLNGSVPWGPDKDRGNNLGNSMPGRSVLQPHRGGPLRASR